MEIAKLIWAALTTIGAWIMSLSEQDAKKVLASMLEWHQKARAEVEKTKTETQADLDRGKAAIDAIPDGPTGGSAGGSSGTGGPTHL